MDYKVPGVFVEEIPTLPPSVAPVATAIPAFIGYTEKALDDSGRSLSAFPVIRRIDTMKEYEQFFGGPKLAKFRMDTTNNALTAIKITDTNADDDNALHKYLLYYSLRHYFDNGGGSCYVTSVGVYSSNPIKINEINNGIDALEKEDEPTLLVLADGIQLATKSDYYSSCAKILMQCNKLKDRFGIFDMPDGETNENFRNGIGSNYLSYGCAYAPYLRTSLVYQYAEVDIDVKSFFREKTDKGIKYAYVGSMGSSPKVEITKDASATPNISFSITTDSLRITLKGDKATSTEIITAWNDWKENKGGFTLFASGTSTDIPVGGNIALVPPTSGAYTMEMFKSSNTQHYNACKTELANQRVVLPPSSALAGIYASVDRDRGVWKAPANVSLASVIAPSRKITYEEQELLNVDPTSGKSINAIRSFAGKGTMVWGSRTLAGNDNEWRYIPVRRLFIFVEESLQKATGFAVFEPNTPTTWLKVKAMAESFLFNLWQRGALAGPTPDKAYYVNVGLGKTMTPQDILEGRMIVDVGIAAARPAEFIVLRFMHKLQEA